MKNLNEIFSKEEVAEIVLYASGSVMDKREFKETMMLTNDEEKWDALTDTQKAIRLDDDSKQEIVVPIYYRSQDYPSFEVVIHCDGAVVYRNLGGCSFRLEQPLKVYEIIMRHKEELEESFPKARLK